MNRLAQHATIMLVWVSMWFALPFVALNRTIGR